MVVDVPEGHANDMSALEETRVAEVWPVPADRQGAIQGLRGLLARAEREGLPVSIAGARHSMGGHTIAEDGIVVDMTGFQQLSFDASSNSLTAGSGVTWREVLFALDKLGKSVAVMQSNDAFTVGGSISVNCHGWQHGQPPIASSVMAMRVMLADGRLVECSRDLEPELFSLVLGGYGLFGIIVEADLAVVDNELYEKSAQVIETSQFAEAFLERIQDPEVGLAIGRLSIDPDSLFDESILKVLVKKREGDLSPISPSASKGLRRTVFRGSVGSDYGKSLRWSLERRFGAQISGGAVTRNTELAEPVAFFANDDPGGTDILFEAFVPHARFDAFVQACKVAVEASPCDLLNVTVRDVREDSDSFLRYADTGMFSFVMLFHQKLDADGEEELKALTREIIDLALGLDGSYYLPYRLHATPEQFRRAYPMADEFWAAKVRFDPKGRFQNKFYRAYGSR